MENLRLQWLTIPALLVLALLLLAPSGDILAQNKNKVDHVVLVHPEGEDCATTPDTLRANNGQTIAFFAVSTDIVVSELNSKPKDRTGGKDLSADKERKAKPGEMTKKLKIKDDAKGFYQYNVVCGEMEDDPPAIIVD